MKRREFIAGLGAVAWPGVVRAQRPTMPVVGYMGNYGVGAVGAPADEKARLEVLKGLADTGFTEGRNVAIEYQWVGGQNDKLPALLRGLIERRVAVLAIPGSTAIALAAKAATQTIPIVFRVGSDPVAVGLVPSLNMPGGNVTGTTTLGIGLGPSGCRY